MKKTTTKLCPMACHHNFKDELLLNNFLSIQDRIFLIVWWVSTLGFSRCFISTFSTVYVLQWNKGLFNFRYHFLGKFFRKWGKQRTQLVAEIQVTFQGETVMIFMISKILNIFMKWANKTRKKKHQILIKKFERQISKDKMSIFMKLTGYTLSKFFKPNRVNLWHTIKCGKKYSYFM